MKRKPPSKTQGGSPTCPYASILRHMPPLHHKSPGAKFDIFNSDACRFVLLAMGLNQWVVKSWSPATTLFNEAGFAGVLKFDHGTRLWQGCDYHKRRKKDKKSPRVVRIMDQIHNARLARKRRGGGPRQED